MYTQRLSTWQNRRFLCAKIAPWKGSIDAVSDRRDGRHQIDLSSASATNKVLEIWWLPTTLIFHWASAQAKRATEAEFASARNYHRRQGSDRDGNSFTSHFPIQVFGGFPFAATAAVFELTLNGSPLLALPATRTAPVMEINGPTGALHCSGLA
ncbi:hypothetical protein HBH56_030400 [Parastagonospora nodorum]|uniref:Uncharacterized protein n=1 Tax=Phaeosphaeria nodorum (strain SN15 / ATCC MYA-4574 / FGSC 10173) TaxID=321614 RepID=A0A7U2F6I4_PHANO|nr:hypothetical protein HBH56_030400 [Parastagonospora nodorum]QRC99277.1 hypothetical protein JI435_436840 [Parastagonospora nodorum SN15]KAH3934601.1 hypothetical protein HBH54_051610 [Parastagonospora nodorum]KAH3985338.1 hypothetical protein HBH52_050460 [Parastagonospora nodorum]KAH4131099.1 hypothetical protein HBH47_013730 [Parastagonospora nodorum]